MNKFIVIALLALVGSTEISAGVIDKYSSSLNLDEIANLKGKNLVFSDYCLSVRDYVVADFQDSTANTVSQVVKSGLQMYWDSSMVQMKALEKLTAQLRNPSAPIEGLDESDPTDAIIASGMKKIQESNSYLKSFLTVFTHAVAAYKSQIGKIVSTHDDSNMSNAELVFTSFQQSCSKVTELETEVRKRFEEAKVQVVAKDPSMAEVEIENVDCPTPKRILNMATVCKFIDSAKEPIRALLGIETMETVTTSYNKEWEHNSPRRVVQSTTVTP